MIRLTRWTCLMIAAGVVGPGCTETGSGTPDPVTRTDSGARLDGSVRPDGSTGPGNDAGVGPVLDAGWSVNPDAAARDGGFFGFDGGSTPTVPGAVGAACASDTECTSPAGSTCQMSLGNPPLGITFPGGYCSHDCTAGAGAEVCGEGASCFSLGIGPALCAKTCTSDADCRAGEGYTCRTPPLGGTGMYCLPPFGFPDLGGDGGFGFPDFGGDGGFGFPDFGGDGGFGFPDFGGDGGFGFPDFGEGGLPFP